METNFKESNFKMTPPIKDYLEKKIIMLDKFIDPNDDSARLDAEIGKSVGGQHSGEIFRTEFNLHVGGDFYRAEAEAIDSYASIDEAIDDLFRQVRKDRKKRFDLLKRGGRKVKRMLRRGFGRGE